MKKFIDKIQNQKWIFILVFFTFILMIIVVSRILKTGKKEKEIKKETILSTSDIIPTIDQTVKVDLFSKDKKEVILSIKNIPPKTKSIEYELSYLASGNLPKGVIGTINLNGEDKIERKITLGTCSSGVCVYDEGVEKIHLTLRFEGDFGLRLFEKEFLL